VEVFHPNDTMMNNLTLDKPLAFFDIESTGTNPRMDRIIDLAIIRLLPGESRDQFEFRFNPEIRIPQETTAIHGITDEDVKDSPTFKDKAAEVAEAFEGCDLAGYNAIKFDIPMLVAEFKRAEVDFDLTGRNFVDPQRIFHRREPRDLTAAVKFYCGDGHPGAHGALADIDATVRIFLSQLERYPDLPRDVRALHDVCNPRHPDWVDQEGRLRWTHGKAAINFGKNQGRPLAELVEKDTGFLNWILQNEFPEDTKQIIRNALKGEFPSPPAKQV